MANNKSWAKKETRQMNVSKLRNALQNFNDKENAEDIEQKIYEKSNSLDEYLHDISKVLVFTTKDKANNSNTGSAMPLHPPGSHVHQMPPHMVPHQMPPHGNPSMMGHNPSPGHPNMPHPLGPSPMSHNPQMMQGNQIMIQGGMTPQPRRPPPGYHPNSPHVPIGAPPPQSQQPTPQTVPPIVPHDDEAYTMKLMELQKRYMARLNKVKENKNKKFDTKRVDYILGILMTAKKVPYERLLQIENLLEKLFSSSKPQSNDHHSAEQANHLAVEKSIGSAEKAPPNPNTKHFCQPLIDGVANHACNSSFYHTVKRTFGHTLYSLHGDVTNYPAAKRHKKSEPTNLELLQSEISRLPSCFETTIVKQKGDIEIKVVHKKSPMIPHITISVPKKYPDQSPWVKTTCNRMGKLIEQELEKKLITLSLNYTLTQILLCWRNCIMAILGSGRLSSISAPL